MADPGQQDGGKASLSFGFSKSKAPARKLAVNMEEAKEKRQQITGFEGGVLRTLRGAADEEEQEGKKVYVIPKLENTYKTGVGKKFVPSFVPPASDAPIGGNAEDRFEMAQQDTRPAVTGYGLETRARPEVKAEVKTEPGEQNGDGPVGGAGQPSQSLAQLEHQAYKEDMEVLPDAPDVDAYDSMPIEEFGKAMLLGMGWKEGQGVGRNRKVAQPIEYLRRPERLGLGAAAANVEAGKKQVVKMGDKPVVRPEELVLAPDADGRVRHVRHLDEKLVHRSEVAAGARPGKSMRVVGGRHAGMDCVVVALLPEDPGRSARASVRLLLSHEVVEVRVKDLDEQRGGSGGKHSRSEERDRAGDEGVKRHKHDETKRSAHKQSRRHSSDDEEAAPKAPSWLAPLIKVRVIDKRVREGRLYLKKGAVVDVHPGGLCDVVLDDGRESVQLKQRQLETVVPKDVGSAVLIVAGRLRGQKARLHAKSAEGACAVQLASDFSIHRLMLDDVAQYLGSLDDE